MKDSKQMIDKLIGKNAKIVLKIIEKNKQGIFLSEGNSAILLKKILLK